MASKYINEFKGFLNAVPDCDNQKQGIELNQPALTPSLEPPKKHPGGRNAPGGPPGNKKAVKHGLYASKQC